MILLCSDVSTIRFFQYHFALSTCRYIFWTNFVSFFGIADVQCQTGNTSQITSSQTTKIWHQAAGKPTFTSIVIFFRSNSTAIIRFTFLFCSCAPLTMATYIYTDFPNVRFLTFLTLLSKVSVLDRRKLQHCLARWLMIEVQKPRSFWIASRRHNYIPKCTAIIIAYRLWLVISLCYIKCNTSCINIGLI